MPLLLIAAAVLYVLGFLSAWPLGLTQNIGHAIAFVAAGLVCALVAGVGPTILAMRRQAPPA